MDDIASALALAQKGLLSPGSFQKVVARVVSGEEASGTGGRSGEQVHYSLLLPPDIDIRPQAQTTPSPAARAPGASSCASSKKRSAGSAPVSSNTGLPKRTKGVSLGAFGFTKTKVDSAGKQWTCAIPHDLVVKQALSMQCPWCDRTFSSASALGSHKSFAHRAANEAAKLAGTNRKNVGEGDVPLDVVNWTMLLIGKLEAELGTIAGAHTVDQLGRKIPVGTSKRKGADRRVRCPVWLIGRAIEYHDKLVRDGFTDPQQKAADAYKISTIKAKLTIAHKFLTENGWDVGRIVKKERTGWAVKYPSERQQ